MMETNWIDDNRNGSTLKTDSAYIRVRTYIGAGCGVIIKCNGKTLERNYPHTNCLVSAKIIALQELSKIQ
jgi:hypothetical protein